VLAVLVRSEPPVPEKTPIRAAGVWKKMGPAR
jgi:hypothetical protein